MVRRTHQQNVVLQQCSLQTDINVHNYCILNMLASVSILLLYQSFFIYAWCNHTFSFNKKKKICYWGKNMCLLRNTSHEHNEPFIFQVI